MIAPEQFWPSVACGHEDECWPWQRSCNGRGYGQLWDPQARLNRTTHRLAFELTHGAIPDGLYVLHECDNRSCCNPAHLRLGTQAANLADMVTRGRSLFGERNNMAKLSDADAEALRERYRSGGVSQRRLAREFGVSQPLVSMIVNNRCRKETA